MLLPGAAAVGGVAVAAVVFAGIGFTMSLFIGGLSFADASLMNEVRLGALSGSLVSAVVGFGVLMLASRRADELTPAEAG